MKKVVVERPRWGSRQRNSKFGARLRYIPDCDYDNQPKRARGFESYARGTKKWFTDVLGPLRRFLRKNLGRPWDCVYSELCAGLDKRKVTGKHVFDHVDQMVEKNCFISPDGRMYARGWLGEHPATGMYVHPRTGLLCEAPRESKRERQRRRLLAQPINQLYLGDNTRYQKHDGVWYRTKLKHIYVSRHPGSMAVWDIFFKREITLRWGWHWLATEKKQCNRDELKDVRRLLAERERKIRNL